MADIHFNDNAYRAMVGISYSPGGMKGRITVVVEKPDATRLTDVDDKEWLMGCAESVLAQYKQREKDKQNANK